MKKWSLSFRIWHWLNVFVLLGIFVTLFLRSTFLDPRANTVLITDKLTALHVAVTADQAKTVARAIFHNMWDWHVYLGYALAALLLYRMILFFTPSGKRTLHFQDLDIHHKAVKAGYIVIYGALFVMALSGLLLALHETFGITKETTESIEDLHGAISNIILFFVPLHIAGVVIADARDEKGIVSDMINGGETV